MAGTNPAVHYNDEPRFALAAVSRQPPEDSRMYIGPDALMPLASALAAVAGFVLMFWRRLVGMVRLVASRVTQRFVRR